MSDDIRISIEFFDHPKTVKLERRLGVEGIKSLISLWLWCRVNKPCGVLSGMDIEDIEIAARWTGEEQRFVNEALTLRWLDVNGDIYSLHDWADHNPWAVGAEERSDHARLIRMARTHPEIYAKLVESGADGVSIKEFQELTKTTERKRTVNAALTPAPAPAPSPVPAPTPIVKEQIYSASKEQKAPKVDFKMPEFFTEELWFTFLENRKFKKLQNSEKALRFICSKLKEAVDSDFSIEECIGAYITSKMQRFDVSWMVEGQKRNGKNQNLSPRDQAMASAAQEIKRIKEGVKNGTIDLGIDNSGFESSPGLLPE